MNGFLFFWKHNILIFGRVRKDHEVEDFDLKLEDREKILNKKNLKGKMQFKKF